MQEYLELKRFLLRRTQRFATFLTVYIFLVAAGKAALCAAVGGASAYIYVAWLCRDVDNVSPNDDVPMLHALCATHYSAGLR